MSVIIVVGAQFGGEGKGKISSILGCDADLSIQAGGPNSGHIVIRNGKRVVFRCIPTTALSSSGILAIGPAGIIDLDILRDEINVLGIRPERLKIDSRALIIENRHRLSRQPAFNEKLSTGVGIGAVVSEHVVRDSSLKRAESIQELSPYLADIPEMIYQYDKINKNILIQGNQGFGLSLYHGDYPYVTNRDTSVAAVCSAVGIAISRITKIVMVVRTFPIRSVSQRELKNEITWDDVTIQANSKKTIQEHTSFLEQVRRVGTFDEEQFRRACIINSPTEIAITFIDYLDASDKGVTIFENLSSKSREFIFKIEDISGVPVTLISTGPDDDEIIIRKH